MRLIDADEIEWADHYDSGGNLTKYKIAYSDEMPPTVEAIPVEWINTYRGRCLAIEDDAIREMVEAWRSEKGSGRLPGKEQMEDTITVKRDWLERIERQAEKYRDLRDQILNDIEEYRAAADSFRKRGDTESENYFESKEYALRLLPIDIGKEEEE